MGGRKEGTVMIKPQNPQRSDVVITQAVDGFWTHRPLDDPPGKLDTLEAAVASGKLITHLERVDLWLVNNYTQLSLLVNCRQGGSQ